MKPPKLSRFAVVCVLTACAHPKPEPTVPAPPITAEPAAVTADLAATPAVATKAEKVRSVEGITEYRLPNGLQVLLFPDPSQSTVTVNITYLVGSRLEGYGETGMAHLLEHMMFKGTPRHRNVLKLLQERGGRIQGTTWADRTNYYETLPATPENLDYALDLEADRMVNATISPDDLKSEFSVVRNEFEKNENNPWRVLRERIASTAYLWHNYGKTTIGSRADIERVPVTALRAFYEKYYQPDNAVLVVAGKFDEAAALASVERLYGAIPRPARTLTPTYTLEPVQDGERSVVLRRNGDVGMIGVAYHTVGAASPDYAAVTCALDLLDRRPSGRLYNKLVETKLAASINAGQWAFRDPYLAVVMAEVRDPKDLDKIERTMISEIEAIGAGKVDDKEVERWRAATLKYLELEMADSQQIAVELSESAALGDWRALFAFRDHVEKVTAADVQRVAKTYFKQSNRTTGRFVPTKDAERAPLTETPDIQAAVSGVKDRVTEQGEVFAATLDNIEARTTRRDLKGGLKATLLPKKTRGGKVQLVLRLHFGDEKTLQGTTTTATLAAMMMTRGTTNKNFQDLQDLQNQLKSYISVRGDSTGVTLSIATIRDKLPQALDLAGEILTSPSFPSKELELIKQQALAVLKQDQQDPRQVAWNELFRLSEKWPKTDPRHPMSIAEQIAAIKATTLGDVKAFYKGFVGAGHGELSVVGDFDAAAISAQVEKLFGGWTSKRPYARLDDKVFNASIDLVAPEIKDKEMSQLVLVHDLMRDTDPDYAAWLMVGQVLGGYQGSRIWMRLREAEGLSYSAGAWTSGGTLDDAGSFAAYAIVAPQNLAKAKASILEEINKMVTGEVSAAELASAKDVWTKTQDTRLSNDDIVTNMLADQSFAGRTTKQDMELRAKVAAVTTEEVARVAKKYLSPARLIIIDAGSKPK